MRRKGGEEMVNVNRLKGLIVENEKSQSDIAKTIKMDRSTFYRKMKDGGNFTVKEVQEIKKAVPLTDEQAVEIFFCPDSRINATKKGV